MSDAILVALIGLAGFGLGSILSIFSQQQADNLPSRAGGKADGETQQSD